jgi:hypothetical protein
LHHAQTEGTMIRSMTTLPRSVTYVISTSDYFISILQELAYDHLGLEVKTLKEYQNGTELPLVQEDHNKN